MKTEVNNDYFSGVENSDKKVDLNNYIGIFNNGKGNTIYDKIDKVLHYNDYSTIGLLKLLRDNPNHIDFIDTKFYREYFKRFMIPLIGDEEGNGKIDLHFDEKKISEYRKKYGIEPNFDSIKEYVDYALKQFDANTTGMNLADRNLHEFLLALSMRFIELDKNNTYASEVPNFRFMIVKGVILQGIKNTFAKDSADPKSNPDWRLFSKLYASINSPKVLANYDETIKELKEIIDKIVEEKELSFKCNLNRDNNVENVLSSMFNVKKSDLKGNQIFKSEEVDDVELKKEYFKWRIKELKQPKVIIDQEVAYSNNPKNNVRVIAVNYGKMEYGTLYTDEDQNHPVLKADLDIIGVTRIGAEGREEDFVLGSIDDKTLRPKLPGEKVVNGHELKTQEGSYVLEEHELTRSQRSFLAAIGLSKYYMDLVKKENFGYLGTITSDGKLDLSSLNRDNATAAKYAREFPSVIGKREGFKESQVPEYSNIEEYFSTIKGKHTVLVDNYLKKIEKDKDQDKGEEIYE